MWLEVGELGETTVTTVGGGEGESHGSGDIRAEL